VQHFTYAALITQYAGEPILTVVEQDEAIRAEAEIRGVPIVQTFTDLNVKTDTSEARIGLLSAIDAVHRGEISALIVASPDRISRVLEARRDIVGRQLGGATCYGKILYLGQIAAPVAKARV